jgi:histidine ammonia-lyase
VENLQSVLAIEWMTAAQGLELRRPLRSSAKIENLFSRLRQEVPFAAEDISMSRYIPLARNLMNGFIPAG